MRILVAAIITIAPVIAFAQVQGSAGIISAFQQYRDVPAISIQVPTVVEIPFDGVFIERPNFAVFDQGESRFEPSYFIRDMASTRYELHSEGGYSPQFMADENQSTYTEFPVPGDKPIVSTITLHSQTPISASALSIALDANVALPSRISIDVQRGEENTVVLADSALAGTLVNFPKSSGSDWTIRLTHVQPLRITELRLISDAVHVGHQSLRFLAQPSHAYRIYFNADRSVVVPAGESGDLANNRDVRRVVASGTHINQAYVQADIDADGISDIRDNCVSVANADQLDVDQNGLGDACQDFDRDGIPNSNDNCPNAPNLNQMDTDSDGLGDVCDGEESRITEKYRWIPWAGIGIAGIVIIGLFALTLSQQRQTPQV